MNRSFAESAAGAVLALLLLALVAGSVPLTGASPTDAPPAGADDPPPQRGADVGLPSFPVPTDLLRALFLGAVVTVVVGAALAIRRLRTDGSPAAPPTDFEQTAGPELSQDTAAEDARDEAERAADRIERRDAGLENEVYRAWYEMTRALGARRPRSETPGRFAQRAVAAGMDEAAVRELTALFRAVRYGDRELTAADEDRAVDLLRRLSEAEAS